MKDFGVIKRIAITKAVLNGLKIVGFPIQISCSLALVLGTIKLLKSLQPQMKVWDAYLEAHSKDACLCYGECSDYEDLAIAVGNGVVVGNNSIGLGSATDARTLGDDENRNVRIEDLSYDAENEIFVGLSENDQSYGSAPCSELPEVREVSNKKRSQPKRSRVQCEANSSSTENIL
ncbi:uncharacterized protein LOC127241842 [Andrographis paniculata]|uniref:uncharacterized protein LOC127241842 n=1 Tax=Andrographis paniculata TaxID=175694 RepID=UPI0021E900AB|nr:uncharacterized protein LOC127241842 [Andrographis paniculata]